MQAKPLKFSNQRTIPVKPLVVNSAINESNRPELMCAVQQCMNQNGESSHEQLSNLQIKRERTHVSNNITNVSYFPSHTHHHLQYSHLTCVLKISDDLQHKQLTHMQINDIYQIYHSSTTFSYCAFASFAIACTKKSHPNQN
jgi:hypothetical protein